MSREPKAPASPPDLSIDDVFGASKRPGSSRMRLDNDTPARGGGASADTEDVFVRGGARTGRDNGASDGASMDDIFSSGTRSKGGGAASKGGGLDDLFGGGSARSDAKKPGKSGSGLDGLFKR